MAARTGLAKKLGIKPDARAYFSDAPTKLRRDIAGADLKVARSLVGEFDYVHVFVTKQKMLMSAFRRVRGHVSPQGALWISWPKNRQLDTDLSLTEIIRIGYDHGLVESKTIGLDAVWSAIKFTHPKIGKTYNNKYGRLRSRPTKQKTARRKVAQRKPAKREARQMSRSSVKARAA
jgi:hypothetical protein